MLSAATSSLRTAARRQTFKLPSAVVATRAAFTRPRSFSRAEYDKGRSWTKRPLLGPDAATSKELDVFYQRNSTRSRSAATRRSLRFVTAMGKIRGRSETNLTWKNQRRMGKAIRRAKMMGIIPVLSKRPLFLDDKDGL
ncbi:hypothetical protein C8T65DRAFT_673698 [Cerioporus squamosus]|nr:hypothetical protein C8T65DRAFT_673698 [Cerioporus squamosus]